MPTDRSRAVRPYHHGDLRAALVEAALELARDGGPAGISLREATRRIGVTPSAAYRHFRGRPELLDAVAREIQERMAARMRRRMRAPREASAQERALQRLRGVGLGYIAFALEEPGWFGTAFFGLMREERPAGGGLGAVAADGGATGGGEAADAGTADGGAADGGAADGGAADGGAADGAAAPAGTPDAGTATEAPAVAPPFALLVDALDACVRAGVLSPERRVGAEFVCWSAVHGCAELVLHGPLHGAPRAMARQVAERVVDDIITGIR